MPLPVQPQRGDAVTYLRRASPLHAARAAVGLGLVRRARARRAVLRAPARARWRCSADRRRGRRRARRPARAARAAIALPFALLDRARQRARRPRRAHGDRPAGRACPSLGQLDITAEATAYGAVLGLRALVVVGCFALHSAAVDPDELLRAFRRVSFRSALTAALATRLVPVLGARRAPAARRAALPRGRAGAAARHRPGGRRRRARPRGRRRRDARGPRLRGRPPAAARRRRPWSRHDLAFAASAVALAVVGAVARSPAPGVRGLPVARGAGRAPRARALRALARLRAAAVRRPPGDRAVSRAALERVTYRTRARPRPRCAT